MPTLRGPVAAGNDLLRHDSLARSAANWIAEHIISGDIKPGEKLTEAGLAERMGVSRSPVREALQALSREGLIILEPRRGARVNRLDAGDMADLYACRLLIDPVAPPKRRWRSQPRPQRILSRRSSEWLLRLLLMTQRNMWTR